MIKRIFFFCILVHFQSNAQNFVSQLYGFSLGQYRETANNELGKSIVTGKYEDGFVYEVFALKPDTSLYIVFEYAASDTNIIWSIQVTGIDKSTEIGYKSAKLGIGQEATMTLFGKPTSIEDMAEYGHKWNYDYSNLSVEVNLNNQLSSVKILDNYSELFGDKTELAKIPSFEELRKVLLGSTNADLFAILSPDLEIYRNESTYFFQKSIQTEQRTDYSKIASMVRELSKDLATINSTNKDEIEENIRLSQNSDPLHVIKFKKGHQIQEIVLKKIHGKYVIYEITADLK
jgi:hypothetical protein